MRNKIYSYIILLILSILISTKICSEEIFNFNVSELEVTQDGNLIKGYRGGEAYTNNGISIKAINFCLQFFFNFLFISN